MDSNLKQTNTEEIQETIQKKEVIPPKVSVFTSSAAGDGLSELALLSAKAKPTSLDKLLSHSTTKPSTWLRPHLIVKIKKEGTPFHKLKGEVVRVSSSSDGKTVVSVRVETGEVREFTEGELGKVVPGEGGVVWLINHKRVGQVNQIDMKTQTASVTCRDSQGRKDNYSVKLDEMCKYKTN